MNLGKVKNFFIIIFLGINIYLLISGFLSSIFYLDKDTVDNCCDVLAKNGITLSSETVPSHIVNLRGIDTENVVYTKLEETDKNLQITIEDNVFSGEFALSDYKDKSILSYFKKLGLETKHMKLTKGEEERYILCSVDGFRIFDSAIKLTKTDNGYAFKGKWYEPLSDKVRSKTKSRECVYVTSILINMLQNEEIMSTAPFEITDIDFGYLAGLPYGDEAHITATALPYYRIKTDAGNAYYFDAKSGEYLKR